MLDLLVVCQRIPPYYSVFVTCLKLISNVLSVYQRTYLIFHTSAYVGAIRRSVTGPLKAQTDKCIPGTKKVSEYDQEIQQSHTANSTMTL